MFGGISGQIGVEEQHRDSESADAFDLVLPNGNFNLGAFHVQGDGARLLCQELLDIPVEDFFSLVAVCVNPLVAIAIAVQEGDGDHRDAQVGCCANGVAREHAQPAAVGWHFGNDADLHREIRDSSLIRHLLLFSAVQRMQITRFTNSRA